MQQQHIERTAPITWQSTRNTHFGLSRNCICSARKRNRMLSVWWPDSLPPSDHRKSVCIPLGIRLRHILHLLAVHALSPLRLVWHRCRQLQQRKLQQQWWWSAAVELYIFWVQREIEFSCICTLWLALNAFWWRTAILSDETHVEKIFWIGICTCMRGKNTTRDARDD